MRILLLSSAYNSLTQHAHVALQSLKHRVGVAAATTAEAMREAVSQYQPDLILCPMLAHIIPRDIWEAVPCIILHPGIMGDRGSASLDWAILNGEKQWGVTAVQAAEHVDFGPIWATYHRNMRDGSKSSLYRDEVAYAAMKAMMVAVQAIRERLVRARTAGLFPTGSQRQGIVPPLRPSGAESTGFAIRWAPSSEKSAPPTGVREFWTRSGMPVYLYGAHEEGSLVGEPGEIIG